MSKFIPYGRLQIKSNDSLQKTTSENMGYIVSENLTDGTEEEQLTFAREIDNFARGVIGLSTNTYGGSTVTVEYKIEDIVANGEGD